MPYATGYGPPTWRPLAAHRRESGCRSKSALAAVSAPAAPRLPSEAVFPGRVAAFAESRRPAYPALSAARPRRPGRTYRGARPRHRGRARAPGGADCPPARHSRDRRGKEAPPLAPMLDIGDRRAAWRAEENRHRRDRQDARMPAAYLAREPLSEISRRENIARIGAWERKAASPEPLPRSGFIARERSRRPGKPSR